MANLNSVPSVNESFIRKTPQAGIRPIVLHLVPSDRWKRTSSLPGGVQEFQGLRRLLCRRRRLLFGDTILNSRDVPQSVLRYTTLRDNFSPA